jgi:hypothetical protein
VGGSEESFRVGEISGLRAGWGSEREARKDRLDVPDICEAEVGPD